MWIFTQVEHNKKFHLCDKVQEFKKVAVKGLKFKRLKKTIRNITDKLKILLRKKSIYDDEPKPND